MITPPKKLYQYVIKTQFGEFAALGYSVKHICQIYGVKPAQVRLNPKPGVNHYAPMPGPA